MLVVFRNLSVFTLILFLFSCSSSKQLLTETTPETAPKAAAEFRAAWVATVSNINWPSKPGLTTQQQQQEAIALLDFLQQHHFNAVIFQIRPQADALYKSSFEPWSYFLTGEQGTAPNPFYDPLEFWTEAAHDRGIELHVWLNPYRAHHKDGGKVSDISIVKKAPHLVHYLKEGYWWLDPALKETQDLTTNVIMDVVKRYDIDGVHFDDYFYPYPSYNLGEDFPDSSSWKAYQTGGGKLSRGDWRRDAVNTLIQRLYAQIKNEKPHVKFGLSPFGIWRPGYPQSVEGFDQYNQLYADARLWLNKGWIDYFVPQLYWKIGTIPQSFPVLLGWWQSENLLQRHLWPGISVNGRDTSLANINETLHQIMISRGMLPKSNGVVHWSLSSLTRNKKMADAVLAGPYKQEALVPVSSWMDSKAPEAPVVQLTNSLDSITLNWAPTDERDAFRYVVYYKYGPKWSYTIVNRNDRKRSLKKITGSDKAPFTLTAVAVTAVDRTGNESLLKEIAVTN